MKRGGAGPAAGHVRPRRPGPPGVPALAEGGAAARRSPPLLSSPPGLRLPRHSALGSLRAAGRAMGCDGRVSELLRRNLQPTLTYWSVFFSFGLCIAFLGPTLLDLRCQTHSSLPQISWVFFSQQLCLLLGSALGGVFKRT